MLKGRHISPNKWQQWWSKINIMIWYNMMIMESQKIGNLSDDTTNPLCKFRKRTWVGISYESWET